MDFVRLNSSYLPDKLIQGYNSLIWTERFQELGEFELKSFDVEGMVALLPENTMVSHLETSEMMMVETHSIELVGEGVDAQPEITIKGRSASLIFNNRWVNAPYQKKRKLRQAYSATTAICVLLFNAVDNATGVDLTRGDKNAKTPERDHYLYPANDAIPNVTITENVASEGAARWWLLEEGLLWPQIQKMMIDQDLGLRCMRPVPPNNGTVIAVSSPLATRGAVSRTVTNGITQLRFEVYSGTDRSASVKISTLQGHVVNPQYLTSNQEFRSVMAVSSGVVDVPDAAFEGTTGWNRRVIGMDAGSPDLEPEPQEPKKLKSNATKAQKAQYARDMDDYLDEHEIWRLNRNMEILAFKDEAHNAALYELKKARKINMFAGDMSDVAPYKYKTHYFLGDTIMVNGDYGKSAKMVVNEYVRTENADGDRGFPGLVAP